MIIKSYILEKNDKDLKEFKINLFYGENIGLKNQFKEKIKKINKGSHIYYTQDEIIKNEINFLRELNNSSLFSETKVIYLENCNDKILNILENYLSEGIEQKIVLFSDNLEKKSKLRNFFEKSKDYNCIPCYPDNYTSLKQIIFEKLKNYQGLNKQNVDLIIDACGNDRYKLKNEIDKIISYFKNKEITQLELLNLLNFSLNDNFNQLKDEALNGNKIKSNKLLTTTLIQSEKIIYYLTILNQRLYKLLEVNNHNDIPLETAIANLKPPIFWADKNNFLHQAKIWKKNKILKMLKKTYKFEIDIKSNSSTNNAILMKKLLVDVCIEASSA